MMKKSLGLKIVALSILAAGTFTGVALSSTKEKEKAISAENGVELSIEKVDRDTVRVALDNVEDIVKSIELSLQISGDITIKENGVKWANVENAISNYKYNEGEKALDLIVTSLEPLKKEGNKIYLCEIDIDSTKGEGTAPKYKITPKNNDVYKYVTLTDKEKSGDSVVFEDTELSMNTAPTIEFKGKPDGVLTALQGEDFDSSTLVAKGLITAFDEEDGDQVKIEAVNKIDTSSLGTVEAEFKAVDLQGEGSMLKVPVVVVTEELKVKPTIEGATNKTINAGEAFDPLAGITAKDSRGEPLDVEVKGEFDTEKPGEYSLTYKAEDRYYNEEVVATKLKVNEKDKPIEPEVPGEPSNPVEPEVPGDPNDPVKPEVPGEPSDPVKPGEPSEPGKPEVPVNPSEPVKPEVPEEPSKPVIPGGQKNPNEKEDALVAGESGAGTSGTENTTNKESSSNNNSNEIAKNDVDSSKDTASDKSEKEEAEAKGDDSEKKSTSTVLLIFSLIIGCGVALSGMYKFNK